MKADDTDNYGRSQHDLATGVLQQAAQDLRRFHDANSRIERELYHDAYSWAMSDDCSWPFSFLNVCRILNREPDALREELLEDLSPSTFGLWARRGSRAFGRLSDSFPWRLATDAESKMAQSPQLVQT